MATFHSAKDLAKHHRERGKLIETNLNKTFVLSTGQVARDTEAFAKYILSGGLSTADLRQLGHPYRRRARFVYEAKPGGGRRRIDTLSKSQRTNRILLGGVPLLPINVQTGALRESVRVTPRKTARCQVLYLSSDVDYSSFQLDPRGRGTSTMKSRRFWRTVSEYARKDADRIVINQLRRAWRQAKR